MHALPLDQLGSGEGDDDDNAVLLGPERKSSSTEYTSADEGPDESDQIQ
jgi:hypothetical protein